MGKGQIGEELIGLIEGVGSNKRISEIENIFVAEHGAFWPTRGARGVYDHGRIVQVYGLKSSRYRVRVLAEILLAFGKKLIEEDHLLMGKTPESLGVPDDHLGDFEFVHDLEDFVHLLLIFHEEHISF